MRVAVLAGGRSSEHEVSLNSAASVRDGVAAAGHEVLAVTIERSGEWALDGEPRRLRPGGGLLGADAVFPVLHGPFGEDGTLQGLLELLDVPYVGAGVLASSLCMDKVVFKEVLAAADVPQVPYAGVREPRWRAEPEAVRRELAALGTPVFVKPARLGSSVGIAKVSVGGRARPGARHRVRARRPRDRRGLLGRDGGRVLGARQRRARGVGARRDRPHRRRLVRLRGQVHAGRHGARRARPAARRACSRRCAGSPWTRSCASAAPAWPGSTSSSRTASACSSTSSTRCRASRRRASTRSCGRRQGRRSRSSATACSRSRSSASQRRARHHDVLGRATSWSSRISEISARSASGASFVIQTR